MSDNPAGSVFYRLSGWGGEQWFRNLRDAQIERNKRKRDGCTGTMRIHHVTLTAKLPTKALALAMLNKDAAAFAAEVEI